MVLRKISFSQYELLCIGTYQPERTCQPTVWQWHKFCNTSSIEEKGVGTGFHFPHLTIVPRRTRVQQPVVYTVQLMELRCRIDQTLFQILGSRCAPRVAYPHPGYYYRYYDYPNAKEFIKLRVASAIMIM
eukprot:1275390-Rhodomonas_salina.1